jgi:hypothetical protein
LIYQAGGGLQHISSHPKNLGRPPYKLRSIFNTKK